jgi:transcriptional regulator with XRE-family HTH domain
VLIGYETPLVGRSVVSTHTDRLPRIRGLRIERGWTQRELAERMILRSDDPQVAVVADVISKWERGEKGVSARYRALLAAVLGVSTDELGLPGLARGQKKPAVPPGEPAADQLRAAASALRVALDHVERAAALQDRASEICKRADGEIDSVGG